MKRDVQPVTIRVADIMSIKAHARGSCNNDYITIPRQYLTRLLETGKVHVHHDYTYTDDYAWDAAVNFQTGDTTASAFLEDLTRWGSNYLRVYYRAPWLDIHGVNRPASIHCYRHLNEGYTITPLEGEITVEPRS